MRMTGINLTCTCEYTHVHANTHTHVHANIHTHVHANTHTAKPSENIDQWQCFPCSQKALVRSPLQKETKKERRKEDRKEGQVVDSSYITQCLSFIPVAVAESAALR